MTLRSNIKVRPLYQMCITRIWHRPLLKFKPETSFYLCISILCKAVVLCILFTCFSIRSRVYFATLLLSLLYTNAHLQVPLFSKLTGFILINNDNYLQCYALLQISHLYTLKHNIIYYNINITSSESKILMYDKSVSIFFLLIF